MDSKTKDSPALASLPEQAEASHKLNHAPAPPPAGAYTETEQSQQGTAADADHQEFGPSLTGNITEAAGEASSQGTASESRPSFLSMLQSKMDKQRQRRRENQSQSASQSDGSLSSVHQATPGVNAQANVPGSTGVDLPPNFGSSIYAWEPCNHMLRMLCLNSAWVYSASKSC